MSGLDSLKAINAWASSEECKKIQESARKAEKERQEKAVAAYNEGKEAQTPKR